MRHLLRLPVLISLFIIAFIAHTPSPARAGDATVSTCDFASLTTAVTTANSGGGTIDFTCSGTIIFTSQLTITATVTINGAGAIVLDDGGNNTRFFTVDVGSSLTIDGLTLQNGNATNGGAIDNDGILTINNSTFTGNSATSFGGAISNGVGDILTINNSTFTGNSASSVGGAIFNNAGTVNISNSTLSGNVAGLIGGAIYNNNNSTMNLSNSIISGNSASDGSAILTSVSNTATSVNTHYEGNGTNNLCLGSVLIADNGGNTKINATGCPGSVAVALSVSALTCNGNNAEFTINAGDGNFDVTGTGAGLPQTNVTASTITLTGPATWSGITITERLGERQSVNIGGITCPVPISASAVCIGNSLQVTIPAGDAPFQVTASSGTLATGLGIGTHTITGFGSQTGVNVTELAGDTENFPLGDIDCTPNNLSASAVCVGADLYVTIGNGEAPFQITSSAGTLLTGLSAGLHIISNAGAQTGVNVTELAGDTQNFPLGNFNCVAPVIPSAPSSAVTVLGCALDSTDGVEVANAPDNTYCRILMKNGGVVSYSGAIPADLIGLGVILAVDVYRLEGGMSVNTFPDYARVCLAGTGRLFYMDGRNAPRVVVELATETEGSLTCGWIPAPGTLILTN